MIVKSGVIGVVGRLRCSAVQLSSSRCSPWALPSFATFAGSCRSGLANMVGVNAHGVDEKIHPLLPAYMTHGHTGMGMGKMAEVMPYPPNTISMKGATGPFVDYISMGGLFTIVKFRDGLTSYEWDPGWYQHPPGAVALKASDADLARDGIGRKEGEKAS